MWPVQPVTHCRAMLWTIPTVQTQEPQLFFKLSNNSLGPHFVSDFDMAGRQPCIFFEFENVLKGAGGGTNKRCYSFIVCIYCFACLYVSVPCACLMPPEDQKRKSSPLELELQVLGTKLGPLGKQAVLVTTPWPLQTQKMLLLIFGSGLYWLKHLITDSQALLSAVKWETNIKEQKRTWLLFRFESGSHQAAQVNLKLIMILLPQSPPMLRLQARPTISHLQPTKEKAYKQRKEKGFVKSWERNDFSN